MQYFYFFLIFTVFGHVYCQEFSYLPSDSYGPSNWGKLSAICGKGLLQSPINIQERNLVRIVKKIPLMIEGYSREPQSIEAINDKNSIIFAMNYADKKPSRLSGGPLIGTYNLENIHFHFGESEHKINNIKYSAEVHMVHFNNKYPNLTAALLYPDGVAVIGFLFQIATESEKTSKPFLNYLKKNLRAGTEYKETVNIFTIQDIIQSKYFNYFSYHGSLTTPPCSESVQWIVAKNPLTITPAELAQFNKLRNEKGLSMTNNWRPIQKTNNRTIYYY